MALPEDTIAPAEEPGDTVEHFRELFLGTYPRGTVLGYRTLRLVCESPHVPCVWEVRTSEGATVEVLNLEAFKTTSALAALLDALAEEEDGEEARR